MLTCLVSLTMLINSIAAPWGVPDEEITAGAAVVMDADTHTVLYGKEMNKQCFPASITKLLTALIVAEECSLDEVVTVSETALQNMEAGAVVAYIKPGDKLTVRDCLYGMLFRSANDIANVLAEHVSGSVEAFSEKMNEKAKELGCNSSNFVNPSGLTSTEHLTTAYDMALIGASCMDNKILMQLWNEESYKMHGISEKPDGFTVTVGHKMLRKENEYYDERVTGGKTGFISASGNTLVTFAESNGRRLVAVCLQDKNPEHYLDTKALLDFGFNYFFNKDSSELIKYDEIEKQLINDKIIEAGKNNLSTDKTPFVTLPNGADLEQVKWDYDYNLPGYAPENAVAKMSAEYQSYPVGEYYLLNDRESDLVITDMPEEKSEGKGISLAVIIFLVIILSLAGGAFMYVSSVRRREADKRREALERRRRRLKSMNVSEEEFNEMLDKYRQEHKRR
ncbi:MAG: D-alanyl-D-alanine carboxypeptidase family protein [Eubacteriales bacterium]|nr:D-alanyl-D-alanine carboxypeptidase family protein [Eubacteriales bacterium]